MSIKKQISLVALLFGACSGIDSSYRPISEAGYVENTSVKPNNQTVYLRDLELDYVKPEKDSLISDYFVVSSLELPREFADDRASLDLGLTQIAAGENSLVFRPLYSPAYEVSFDNLKFERVRGHDRNYLQNYYFGRGFELAEDDPERERIERGIIASSLGRWIWNSEIFRPVKNVADSARDYSNQVVRNVFGSHAEFDYNGDRVMLGYSFTFPSSSLNFRAWTEPDNLDNRGLFAELVLTW